MTNKDIDSDLKKAFAQLKVALEDDKFSSQFDEDSQRLLKISAQNLVGSWYSDVLDALDSLPSIVTQLSNIPAQVGSKVESAATAAVNSAVKDLKDTGTFIKNTEAYVAKGATHVVSHVTSTVVNDVVSPIEGKLLATFGKDVFNKLPYAGLIKTLLLEAEAYEKRLEYVFNSLYKLERAITGNPLTDAPFKLKFRTMEKDAVKIAEWVFDHSMPGVVLSLVRQPTFANVLSKLVPLPPKVAPDFLHTWLTEEAPIDEKLRKEFEEEREFRKQFVACIDQFARDKQSQHGQLAIPTGADAKTALNLLSEFMSVLFSCIGGFAFRHPTVPSLTLPKLHWTSEPHAPRRPFDGAHIVSTGVGRSVSYTIKSTVGTIGRGIWEINAHNDALVESIASGIASLVGTLVQSVLHDLFWCLDIREMYQDDSGNALITWKSVPDGEGLQTCWGATVRRNMVPKQLEKKLEELIVQESKELNDLVGLLHSYTAYMDAIRSYTDHAETQKDETLSITSHDNANVTVEYQCMKDETRCPVIRAYRHGAVRVMAPDTFGKQSKRTYSCAFNSGTPDDAQLFIRSNWGAVAQYPD